MEKYRGKVRTIGGVLLVALCLTTLAEPSRACEPVHQLRREITPPTPTPGPGGQLNPPATLCWSGPCKKRHGVLDTMGKYAVHKLTGEHRIDFLQMDMYDGDDNLLQTLVAPDGAPVCGPPASTVSGCTERYKVPNVRACPSGTGPNCPGQKIVITLKSIEEVNEMTTSGGGDHALGRPVPARCGAAPLLAQLRGLLPGFWAIRRTRRGAADQQRIYPADRGPLRNSRTASGKRRDYSRADIPL